MNGGIFGGIRSGVLRRLEDLFVDVGGSFVLFGEILQGGEYFVVSVLALRILHQLIPGGRGSPYCLKPFVARQGLHSPTFVPLVLARYSILAYAPSGLT